MGADDTNQTQAMITALGTKIDTSLSSLHGQIGDVKQEQRKQGERLAKLEVEHDHTRAIAAAARDAADHVAGEMIRHVSRLENTASEIRRDIAEVQAVNVGQDKKLDTVLAHVSPPKWLVTARIAVIVVTGGLMALGISLHAETPLVLGVPAALAALAYAVLGAVKPQKE
jgi:hypothetical protein